jgi:hypothetical protein
VPPPFPTKKEGQMGFLDDAKDKISDLVSDHPDKVEEYSDQGIDRAGDALDAATEGRYADQVDAGQQKADDAIGE